MTTPDPFAERQVLELVGHAGNQGGAICRGLRGVSVRAVQHRKWRFLWVDERQEPRASKLRIKTIIKATGALSASNTKREAKHVLAKLDEKIEYADFLSLLTGLSRLLKGEIGTTRLYVMETEKAAYFKQVSAIFGTQSVICFPGVEYDLEEATKCLAVSRNTASVFHLMRAMEVIVAIVGQTLNATIIDKNDKTLEWGKILSNMVTPIEAMEKGPERTKWNAAHTMLYHIKEAWRNPTMHPSEKYTDDEAREIMEAVKVFVRHLAALVDPWSGL